MIMFCQNRKKIFATDNSDYHNNAYIYKGNIIQIQCANLSLHEGRELDTQENTITDLSSKN